MYNWKDLTRGALAFTILMLILTGFMVLNGLHYAGWF